MRSLALASVLCALVWGCKGKDPAPTDTDSDADTDADADADTDADADADADADSDADADTDSGWDSGDSGDSGGAPMPCLDDALEPNDSLFTAIASVGGSNLVVCPQSPDFWAFTVAPGEGAHVVLAYLPFAGDLDIELFDTNGMYLGGSYGYDGTEEITWFNGSSADVDLVLAVYTWWASLDYEWELLTFQCADDPYEPNNLFAAATPLDTDPDLTLSVGDPDHYRIAVPPGELASIEVDFDEAYGDIDLHLFDLAGNLLDTSLGYGVDRETVRWYNAGYDEAEVVLRVDYAPNSGASSCSAYALTTVTSPVDCAEDPFEPNDLLIDAFPTDARTGLGVSVGNADFWRITVEAQSVSRIGVDHDPADGALQVELYDGNGAPIAAGNPSYAANPALVARDVFARVSMSSGVCATYDLTLVDATPDCAPDLREEDDSPAQAAPIAPGLHALHAAPGDEDHALFEVPDGHAVFARLSYAEVLGQAEVSLFDAATGALFADSRYQGALPKTVAWDNLSGLDTTVRVRVDVPQASFACLDYALDLSTVECTGNDAHEPNDSPATATDLLQADGLLDDPDMDHYAVGVVPVGGRVFSRVTFASALGDVDLALVDDQGMVLATSWYGYDEEVIEWVNPGPADLDVFVQVDLWDYSAYICLVPYTMTTTVTP